MHRTDTKGDAGPNGPKQQESREALHPMQPMDDGGESGISVEPGSDSPRAKVFHTGWRLHGLTAGICMGLLLSTLETTIVSTSLVSIVDSLEGFERSSWVVTSYLLTYTGFLIIFSKLSDIFGCKFMLLCALSLFVVFSIVCGAANTMETLIIFRAFQGMGGSGIYSLSVIIVPIMVPPEKYAYYIAITSSVFTISSVLGPVLGGAISDHSTWRWVFYLNAPGGVIAAALIFFSIPFGFPYGKSSNFLRSKVAEKAWKRIDFLGAFLSLAASILIIFGLEQGGTVYPWGSGAIVSSLAIAGVLWIGFVVWERQLSLWNIVCEPLFPWRLARDRFVLGLLLNGFLTGFPFMVSVINIPQKLQTVSSASATDAGIKLLPLLLISSVAVAISGALVSRMMIPPIYVFVAGTSLQTIGAGLFSAMSATDHRITGAEYGYQIILGLGFGLNMSTILLMAPMVVKDKDLAVTIGSVTQIRVLGGTIGLAGCHALLVSHITRRTSTFLTKEQVAGILLSSTNIKLLPSDLQQRTRTVFAEGYAQQMRIVMYFSVVSVLGLALMVEKRPRHIVKDPATGELSMSTPPK